MAEKISVCLDDDILQGNQYPYSSRKKIFDYAFATLALTVLSLVLIVIVILIKLDSQGPALFRQPRMGYNNRVFLIYKFRTMYHHAADVNGTTLTSRNDKRITRVGKWLRKWSIDEIPQFLNVLKGEMSIVGPRPHPIQAKAGDLLYSDVVPNYDRRHAVKPGLTGWAQVNGHRGETTTPKHIQQRVAHDLTYIRRQSLLLDIWIVLRTVGSLSDIRVF